MLTRSIRHAFSAPRSLRSVAVRESVSSTGNSVRQRWQSSVAAALRLKDEQTSVDREDVVRRPARPSRPTKPRLNPATMTDEEIVQEVDNGSIKFFNIENELGNNERGVKIRRQLVEQKVGRKMDGLPYEKYDKYYEAVKGQCCENVIGLVPVPVGVAGPLTVDGRDYWLPMATTEGALIASTTRGCKALSMSGGVNTEVIGDGMSRAPVLSVPNVRVAHQIKRWCETNFDEIAGLFNKSSRFARLQEVKCYIAGRKLFMRFKCTTGDAMGMNMVGKGVDQALAVIINKFEGVNILSLSGNMCTDKKPSAINWVEGRGKSVVCDAVIRGDVVRDVLKTSVAALCELNYAKNLVGSAMAGSVGGFNAHASNVVTAMFLATGQDPAQNVESSNCMTLMEPCNNGEDLYVSVNLPSMEVGTIGGGTNLPGQAAMLDLLGVRGSDSAQPGKNSAQLARVIAGAVMAGELSLMSALSSGHLISSHMKLNRKPTAAAAAVNGAVNGHH